MSSAAARFTIDLLAERFDDVINALGGYPEHVAAEARAQIEFDLLNLKRVLLVAALTTDTGLTWFRARCGRALIALPAAEDLFRLDGLMCVVDARNELCRTARRRP